MVKKCTNCQEYKELDLFFKCAANIDGHASLCKNCDNMRKYIYLRRKSKERGAKNRIPTLTARELLTKGLKYCPSCKCNKTFDEYYTSGVHNSGLASFCIPCSKIIAHKRLDKDREKRKKDYQAKKNIQRDLKLKKQFGISLEDYNNKLKLQNQLCKICGLLQELNGKALAVDHNHKNGQVRDLLCGKCNAAIGFINENPEIALKIVNYLKKWST